MSLYNKIIDLQKLKQAWERVRRNKPAAGLDNVTVEQFEARCMEELKQLQIELKEHRYKALPVKKAVLYKGEKAREIALYSMRDKVVQQSIAAELNRIYEPQFSAQTYAYRSNQSALNAVNAIDQEILQGKYSYILKFDIAHFFDTIQWNHLKRILSRSIFEEDVLFLIEENAKSIMLDDTGNLVEKRLGIYQGSGISPVLSNIYLMDFDKWLAAQDVFSIRYSDDALILGENKEYLLALLKKISLQLNQLGLQLNEEKTCCVSVSEGVNFLGYHFSGEGKSVPAKAKQNLSERLEFVWLTADISFEEKIVKCIEIIGGWEQYFRDKMSLDSIFEYIALFYAGQDKYLEELIENRKNVVNIYRDIMMYLAKSWRRIGRWDMELLEYEQYYQIWRPKETGVQNQKAGVIDNSFLQELLVQYRKLTVEEEADVMIELMQIYTDLQEYEKASFWMEKATAAKEKKMSFAALVNENHGDRLEDSLDGSSEGMPADADGDGERRNVFFGGLGKGGEKFPEDAGENQWNLSDSMAGEGRKDRRLKFDHKTAQKLFKLFVGREECYGQDTIGYNGRREVQLQTMPLTEQALLDHLNGRITVSTYIQRPNGTVKYFVVDVDVSKKILLQYNGEEQILKSYMEKALRFAGQIVELYRSFGMEGYVEASGGRGYHVWLLFTEWIPVRYVNMFSDVVEERLTKLDYEGLSYEFFPNKTKIRPEKLGQAIKIPFGMHVKSGRISYFYADNGEIVTDINAFLDSMARFSLTSMKKVLAVNAGMRESVETKSVDMDLEAFGKLPASIMEILLKCNLMRYLCQKASKTGYLTHFERLSILYVFGHVGEDGKQFVHTVMSMTLNYQYNTTERFIQKMPEKPISCLKLREQYKQITAEYGCSCNFKRSKNCYPSPILHAISLSNDVQEDITLPTSRTLTKENEQKVINEINIHKKAQELAARILEMKKQKRGLDNAIAKIEKELEGIYDNAGVDCLEVEMGLLVRRRKESGGYEWLIEI